MRPSFIGCHSFDGRTFTGDEDWVALAGPAYGGFSAEIIFTRPGSFRSSLAQAMPRTLPFLLIHIPIRVLHEFSKRDRVLRIEPCYSRAQR